MDELIGKPMSSNKEIWAKCGDCGTELTKDDKQCPKCGSTKKAFTKETLVKVGAVVSGKTVQKRKGFKKPLREIIFNRWKRSGDPKLKNGVREDRVIDREKNEYHQVVRDAKTNEVTHEEHQVLSEHKTPIRKTRIKNKELNKWLLGIVGAVLVSLIFSLIWFVLLPILQKPISPNITSFPSLNPIENSGSINTIQITVTPNFNPPYYVGVLVTIDNPNSYRCDMTIEFRTSEGFYFSPMKNDNMTQFYKLPQNFNLAEGYEYRNVMTANIKDFPANFPYDITFSVYTMNPDIYRGKENVTWKVLTVQKVQ